MVKRLILASFALLMSGTAIAGPQPPDVAAFSQVTPNYKTDGTINTVIDSTVTPMPIGSGLTNIPIPSTTNRIGTTSDQTESSFTGSISGSVLTVPSTVTSGKIRVGDEVFGSGITGGTTISSFGTGTSTGSGTYNLSASLGTIGSETMGSTNKGSYCLTLAYGGPADCDENKFRTVSSFTVMLPDDPERNYSQFGASHLHCFFGAGSPNALSDYQTLRNHSLNSGSAGTDVNGTAYWFPCITTSKYVGTDSKSYAIKPDSITLYYTENPATNGTGNGAKAFIPNGLRYVFGFDMDAVWSSGAPLQFAWLQTILNTANAAQGYNRYSLTSKSTQFTGSIDNGTPGVAGTTLHVSSVSAGALVIGQTLIGSGVNPGTRIVAGSGTTWTVDSSQAVSSSSIYAGLYSEQGGYTCAGATPAITYVIKNGDGSDPFGGTCEAAVFTGSVSGTVLTVSAVTSGTILNGMYIGGSGIANQQISITSLGTGTGGTGTYNLSTSATISSETMYSYRDFFINMSGPNCYDGTNLWDSTGYKHLIPAVWDTVIGSWTCPNNYYKLPNLAQEFHFTHYGFTADRQYWDLSSDIAYRSKYSLTQINFPPGSSLHEDWDDGWDDVQRRKWETNCSGVEHHTGHQCDTSQIDATEYLKGGYAGESGVSRAPQVPTGSVPHLNETDPGYLLIPPAWSGSMSNMHIHT